MTTSNSLKHDETITLVDGTVLEVQRDGYWHMGLLRIREASVNVLVAEARARAAEKRRAEQAERIIRDAMTALGGAEALTGDEPLEDLAGLVESEIAHRQRAEATIERLAQELSDLKTGFICILRCLRHVGGQ